MDVVLVSCCVAEVMVNCDVRVCVSSHPMLMTLVSRSTFLYASSALTIEHQQR